MNAYDWNPTIEDWKEAFELLRSDACSLEVFNGEPPFEYEFNGRKYSGETVNISYTVTPEEIEYSKLPVEHLIASRMFSLLCPVAPTPDRHYILGFQVPELQRVDRRINVLFRFCFSQHLKPK